MQETKAKKPLVSIVIPYYNVDIQLIQSCIDSILQQTYQEFEIIIINDGSTEEYSRQLCQLSQEDDRIRVIPQNNKGVSAARNNGTELAKGKYTCYIDSDDSVVPYFLEEAVSIAEKEDADAVFGGVSKYFGDSADCPPREQPCPYKTYTGDEVKLYRRFLLGKVRKICDGKGAIGRGSVAKLVRTETIRKVKFEIQLKYAEDVIWNLDLINACRKVCIADQIWYRYYTNDHSATHKFNPGVISGISESLLLIPGKIDPEDDKEYTAYGDMVAQFLWRYVYKCYFGHPDLQKSKEIRKQKAVILKSRPWNILYEKRYLQHSGSSQKIKGFLVKYGLIFQFWKLMDMINGKNRR